MKLCGRTQEESTSRLKFLISIEKSTVRERWKIINIKNENTET